jgi:hypothetical protein
MRLRRLGQHINGPGSMLQQISSPQCGGQLQCLGRLREGWFASAVNTVSCLIVRIEEHTGSSIGLSRYHPEVVTASIPRALCWAGHAGIPARDPQWARPV